MYLTATEAAAATIVAGLHMFTMVAIVATLVVVILHALGGVERWWHKPPCMKEEDLLREEIRGLKALNRAHQDIYQEEHDRSERLGSALSSNVHFNIKEKKRLRKEIKACQDKLKTTRESADNLIEQLKEKKMESEVDSLMHQMDLEKVRQVTRTGAVKLLWHEYICKLEWRKLLRVAAQRGIQGVGMKRKEVEAKLFALVG